MIRQIEFPSEGATLRGRLYFHEGSKEPSAIVT
jgi:hypothetical protein